jgi:hypothetical protein
MADKARAMLAALPSSRSRDARTSLEAHSDATVRPETPPSDDDPVITTARIRTEPRIRVESTENSEFDGAAFVERLNGMVKHEDINSILELQGVMLQRFEKSNTQLDRLNEFSRQRYFDTVEQFRRYTNILTKMKRNLDSIFRRIKDLKHRLQSQHPEDFMMVASELNDLEEDSGEDEIDTRDGAVDREERRDDA